MSPAPRHILDLTAKEKHEFINSFDIVFSDCDGVVWTTVKQKIHGAGEGVNELKKAGKKIVFSTNNSLRTDEEYVQDFKDINVNVDLDDIIYPAKAIIYYLQKINFDGLVYCIATKKFKDRISSAGFKYIDGPNEMISEEVPEFAKKIFDKAPVRAVIIDIDQNLTATKMLKANIYLSHPDCILIGGAADIKMNFGGAVVIGPGAYIKLLEEISNKKASILGKPGDQLINIIKEQYRIKDPRRCLFIGDNMEVDVYFGKACGFQTLFVLSSGGTIEDFAKEENSGILPDYYADSMADFIEFFKGMKDIKIN